MGTPRTMPSTKAASRAVVPVDTTGMDPEMAATIGGEKARIMKQKALYAPQAVRPKKKTNMLQDFVNRIRGK